MEYVNNLETGKKVIIQNHPEFINSNFNADNSGWTNFAIKVDGKYLFRFPRNDEAYKAVNKEYKILKILNEKLPSHIKVPKYIYSRLHTDYPYVGYELIEGEFLTNELYERLSAGEKEKVLNGMSEFLNILHSIDYKELNLEIKNPIQWYKEFYGRIQKICFKYFDEDLKAKTIELFENYFNDETMTNYTPTLIHGDLSEDHILVTGDGVGIIDFGDLMVFEPSYDLIWAYILGKDFYNKLLEKYNGNKDENFEHRIRDFHIKRPPYDGIIYADEINDEELLKEELQNLKNNLWEEC